MASDPFSDRWRVVKWVGVGLSLLIFVAWALSLCLRFEHVSVGKQVGPTTGVWGGRPTTTLYEVYNWSTYWLGAGYAGYADTSHLSQPRPLPRGWSVGRPHSLFWKPQIRWRQSIAGGGYRHILLPLWIPFLLIAIPTGLLWYLDRRRILPGHCQKCGYNLTGNVSGICPECGVKIGDQVRADGEDTQVKPPLSPSQCLAVPGLDESASPADI